MRKILWFATNNDNKVKEIQRLLPEWQIKSLKDLSYNLDIVEDKKTFEGNALLKAKVLAKIVLEPVIADDSGLCIKNMNNFPGVFSARWALPETDEIKINDFLLNKMLEQNLIDPEQRKATFKTVIVFYDPIFHYTEYAKGKVDGIIALKQSGKMGFNYDKIFIPDKQNRTFAEMTLDEKNQFSHRAKAAKKLESILQRYIQFKDVEILETVKLEDLFKK
ncbi:RdgB/HAM1 family non-canonical purine NTP pyrophosphatase [Spiroplasma endosymbiont of Labia minor]|uniref:RdgB/HAM1 family non-canonical purine NTP pyrophosphatase n=1 Tax=Spiroplasma endosymbiont of Labia minor TaxID=3066305 RepID=UPI0030D421A2